MHPSTTSWAPALGGATTFGDTIAVYSKPIRLTLSRNEPDHILNWTGGQPPFRIQRATDLSTPNWINLPIDSAPPVTLPREHPSAFYRIIGQ